MRRYLIDKYKGNNTRQLLLTFFHVLEQSAQRHAQHKNFTQYEKAARNQFVNHLRERQKNDLYKKYLNPNTRQTISANQIEKLRKQPHKNFEFQQVNNYLQNHPPPTFFQQGVQALRRLFGV